MAKGNESNSSAYFESPSSAELERLQQPVPLPPEYREVDGLGRLAKEVDDLATKKTDLVQQRDLAIEALNNLRPEAAHAKRAEILGVHDASVAPLHFRANEIAQNADAAKPFW